MLRAVLYRRRLTGSRPVSPKALPRLSSLQALDLHSSVAPAIDAIRVVLVDDEAVAMARLRRMLEAEPEVTVVAECDTGRSALRSIAMLRPDVVFLDVATPQISGFDLARALPSDPAPYVVVVAADDAHAVRAFEMHAVHYLLKPIDAARVREAVTRVRRARELARAAHSYALIRSVIGDVAVPAHTTRLVVRTQGCVRPVRVDEIDWIDALGNYARLHVLERTFLLRSTLRTLEAKLDPTNFCRVHRAALVNLERVAEVQPFTSGNSIIIMRDGTRVRASRRYRAELERRLGPSV